MLKRQVWRHLIDVFHWSREEQVQIAEVLAAALGMAVPVLIGLLSGHGPAGFAAALGGLAVSRVEVGASFGHHVRREAVALTPVLLASMIALTISANADLSEFLLVPIALFAALIGGFSRAMTIASVRFILFLMIVSAVPNQSLDDSIGLLICIMLGAIWTSVLGLAFGSMTGRTVIAPVPGPEQRQATRIQKLKHWLKSLKSLAGWTYTMRLGACLVIAAALQWAWPHHHLHWISITIVLLISRRRDSNRVKTTQRMVGTGLGVIIAGAILHWSLPLAVLVALIGLLAGARCMLKQRNYLAYSAVMTPLVMLVIDAGHPPDISLLADCLFATVIGGVLVIVFERIFKVTSCVVIRTP